MKVCGRCNEEKKSDEFYTNKKSKDGLNYACRRCINDYKNAWRDKKNGKNPNYKLRGRKIGVGKGFVNKYGYRILTRKGHPNAFNKVGGVPEHVVVMGEFLGRSLRKGENVHHKNGIRDDNRIENLELWTRKHPPGQRVSDKIEWCIAFLSEYGYKISKE